MPILKRYKKKRKITRVRRAKILRAPTRVMVVKRRFDFNNTNVTFATAGNGSSVTNTVDGVIINTGTANTTNVVYISGAIHFTLSMCPDFTEFQSLFEQYKIDSAWVSFRPFQTTVLPPAVAWQPPLSIMLYVVKDYDDVTLYSASNAGLQQMRSKQGVRQALFFRPKPHIVSIKPRTLTNRVSASANQYAVNNKSEYLDTASVEITHYGIKFLMQTFVPVSSVANYIWFRLEGGMKLSLKGIQ